MADTEKPSMRLRLPTGRETSIAEAFRFCYDLSETDTAIFFELLQGKECTVDELSEKLKLSKATINRSLTKLVELGFVQRSREKKGGAGRPKYRYYIEDPQRVLESIINDFSECARAFQEALKNYMRRLIEEKEKEGHTR